MRINDNGADFIELQFRGRVPLEAVHVYAIAYIPHLSLHPLGRVFDEVLAAKVKRLVVHPDQARVDAARDVGRMRGRHQHVPPAYVDFVFETHGHRHGREGPSQLAVLGDD